MTPKQEGPPKPGTRPKLELISTPKTPPPPNPDEPSRAAIETLRGTPKWEIMDEIWDLEEEHAVLASSMPRLGSDTLSGYPYTPLEQEYIGRHNVLREAWSLLASRAAGLTKEDWKLYVWYRDHLEEWE